MPAPSAPWWLGEGLGCGPRGLELDGHPLAEVAAREGTPLYAYGLASLRRQLGRLRQALSDVGAATRVYYAMKANRHGAVLRALRQEGDVGIDACSPREAVLALETGFRPPEISVTGSMLSDRDLDFLVSRELHLNLDTFSALRRYAARAGKGRRVGLRLDPAVEAGYLSLPKLVYGNTKFGFHPDDVEAAHACASDLGLVVDTLHLHLGWGLQATALPQVDWVFERLAGWARRLPSVEVVNVGGGLGVRRREADSPLSLEAWAAALRRHLAPLGLTLACEPGTLLVDVAGVLVVEVNTVERKAGVAWVGVDAGHNVNVYAAHYGIPIEVVHLGRPLDRPEAVYSVAGNINESNDVFARDVPLPAVREGDLLALLPAGAYGASMASDHCLRGLAREVAL